MQEKQTTYVPKTAWVQVKSWDSALRINYPEKLNRSKKIKSDIIYEYIKDHPKCIMDNIANYTRNMCSKNYTKKLVNELTETKTLKRLREGMRVYYSVLG